MAFFGWATSPILCLIPTFFFLGMAGNLGNVQQRERAHTRQWLFYRKPLAAAVALCIVKAAVFNRDIMDIVCWKRVLLRGLVLLAVGINAVSCFIVLMRVGVDNSSTAESSACAIVAIATYISLTWNAVFAA